MDCVVEHVIFRNEQNGYTVLEVKAEDERVTAVGKIPWVNAGECLCLVGRWKTHHNFGMQFCVESYERFMPSETESIVKYLSSGIIKGLGISTAERIVDKFGEETLIVLENQPEKTCEIKGISIKKAQTISEKIKEINNIKNITESLKKYEISPEETIKIYKNLGENAINLIEDNPYVLCENGIDLSFEKVDAIAQNMNKPHNNISRINGGIIHILRHNTNNGHTCLPLAKLVPVASEFLGVFEEAVLFSIRGMVSDEKLKSEILRGQEFVFIRELYDSEAYCALRIKMILGAPRTKIKNAKTKIQKIEDKWGIRYSESQKAAIETAVSGAIFVLTGGPGTGKTTTLRAIIDILEEEGEKILIAAPTGRAAQRITQINEREAQTIHRLLEVHWDAEERPIFRKNEDNLLDCDTLILDEASMVDLSLFEGVIKALPLSARLIVVGDSDQLPSIGAGNILRDLVFSEIVPVVKLKEIFRQSEGSLIVTNAHKIVRGEMPELKVRNNDFFFLPRNNISEIRDTVLDLYKNRLPKSYSYNPLFDIQILSPGRKGMLGSENLNLNLQKIMNPEVKSKKEVNINGVTIRENDKVMQNKNNYDVYWEKADGSCGEGVFNGDIGIILEIDLDSSHIVVRYDDKIAVYEMELAGNLELAYAATVHKSQGSEFKAVILPLFGQNSKLHYRSLLYTAVTRAKSQIIVVGAESTIKDMVKNNQKNKRYSGLAEFLSQ
jgi:helicase, putative, RecD/TraA family